MKGILIVLWTLFIVRFIISKFADKGEKDMLIKNEAVIQLAKSILGNEVILCEGIETNNNTVFVVKAAEGKEYIVKFYSYRGWPEIDKVPYINQLLQKKQYSVCNDKSI